MVFIETERLVLRNTAAKDADSMITAAAKYAQNISAARQRSLMASGG